MKTPWFIIVVFVLVAIALFIFLLRRNQKDRKTLFKKLPDDYPDPTIVESEFDIEKKI